MPCGVLLAVGRRRDVCIVEDASIKRRAIITRLGLYIPRHDPAQQLDPEPTYTQHWYRSQGNSSLNLHPFSSTSNIHLFLENAVGATPFRQVFLQINHLSDLHTDNRYRQVPGSRRRYPRRQIWLGRHSSKTWLTLRMETRPTCLE